MLRSCRDLVAGVLDAGGLAYFVAGDQIESQCAVVLALSYQIERMMVRWFVVEANVLAIRQRCRNRKDVGLVGMS